MALTKKLIYMIGPSGAGKTTAMGWTMQGIPFEQLEKPLAHMRYQTGAIQLGAQREHFSGTDALPLNASPRACDFLATEPARIILGEGDRLANNAFFTAAASAGYELTIVYLRLSEAESWRRCQARGSRYSQSWVKGRYTKSERLAAAWKHAVWTIDARRPPAEIAEMLLAHPAIAAARAGGA